MDRFIKKVFKYNGLTLVEVLVSVIITTLLMLYGTSFFIASWRLSAESEEYSTVLNDVVSNLESYRAKAFDSPVSLTTDYIVKNRTFRNKYNVTYTLSRSNTEKLSHLGTNYYYVVISSAEWSYGQGMSSANKISVKTAVAVKWEHL